MRLNWKKITEVLFRALEGDDVPKEEELKIKGAVQAFVFGPYQKMRGQIEAIRGKVQSVAVSTDFPVNITNLFNITIEKTQYDMGYEAAFRSVPRDENKQFWEIGIVRSGVKMRRIPEGGRVRVEGMEGEELLAYVDYYGGAIGWTDAMIRWRKFARMLEAAEEFRDSHFIAKADNHYLLLAAAALLHQVAWQAGATQLARDIATFNFASAQLGFVNKDKGYAVTGQTPFILYAHPFDESRIEAAYAATNTDLIRGAAGATAIAGRPVRRVYSYNQYVRRLHPFLVLPGHKLQKNEALAPTTYNAPQDILTLNRMMSAWSIYGAAVADTEQCMQVNLE